MNCSLEQKESYQMVGLRLLFKLAATLALWIPTQTSADHACKPILKSNEVRFSSARNQQRKWTANLAVDPSHCTEPSGLFEIKFARLKKVGPDLFTEQFKWSPAVVEVSLDFWWYESVYDYWIAEVWPCGCVG